ncbi:MAG: response regulator [Caldilineaceae bacterium]|nr:response regulator [Caldilineaceae bacterium]
MSGTKFFTILLGILILAAAMLDTAPPILAQESAADSFPIVFDHIGVEDGLSYPGINGITQDDQGFLWIATSEGLNRYDGMAFKVYKHDPNDPTSLSRNQVEAVVQDNHNPDIFWVATEQGLNRFDRRTETFTWYLHDPADPDSLAGDNIYELVQTANGLLWVGTASAGLDRFDPATGIFTHFRHDPDDPASLSEDRVRLLYLDREERLWVSGVNGGISRFDPSINSGQASTTGSFTHLRPEEGNPNSLPDERVRAFAQARDGSYWVGTRSDGLSRYDPASGQFTHYRSDPENPNSLSGDAIETILEDRSGILWVGTLDDGLNRLDPATGVVTRYTNDPLDKRSFAGTWADVLFEDRSGLIWVGTEEGLNKFDPRAQPFRLLRHDPQNENSLSHNRVMAVLEDADGLLWLGSPGGLDRYDPRTGLFTHYRHDPNDPNSLGYDKVESLALGADSILWVGTEEGLNRFDPATGLFTAYLHDPDNPNSPASDDIWSLWMDKKGILWIGTWDEGLNRFDPATETFTRYPYAEEGNSLSDNRVHEMAAGPDGLLWIATDNGLNSFDPKTETFTNYLSDLRNPNSLALPGVRTVYVDRENIVWIGTRGAGLDRLDPSTLRQAQDSAGSGQATATGIFTHYGNIPEISSGIHQILEDSDGALWLTGRWGIARFNKETVQVDLFDYRQGVQNFDDWQMGAQLRARDGTFYFGSHAGLQSFRPDGIESSQESPPVLLTELRLNNRAVKPGVAGSPLAVPIEQLDSLTLAYDQNDFGFDFAALSYFAPQQNRYQFRLDGFQDDWVERTSQQRSVDFTGLPPGRYTLRVRGSNNDGVWSSQEIALPITITPPWWQTLWFQAGLGLLALGLIFGGVRWRVHSVQRRNRELEQQVAQRTAELADTSAYLDNILRSATDYAIITADRELRITYFNPQAEAMYSTPEAEALGQPIAEICAKKPDMAHFEAGLRKVESHGAHEYVMVLEAPHGPRHIASRVSGIYDDAGQLLGYARFSRDVTERVQTEARLLSQQRSIAALEERGQIGRELHDRLGQIFGFLSLQSQSAQALFAADKQEVGLIALERLGDVAQDAHNQVREFILGMREATAVSQDFWESLRAYAERLGTLYRYRVALTLPAERGRLLPPDKELHLLRIIQEALTNARLHSGADEAQVSFRQEGGLMQVRISDAGRGFDAEAQMAGADGTLADLARPAAPNSAAAAHFGLLGMAERAAALGGGLQIYSQPGEGTRVEVSFPVGQDAGALAQAGPLQELRVLLVDDQPIFLEGLHNLLTAYGLHIVGMAHDGLEAQALARTLRPDVIVMDIHMPVCDGIEATRRIKADFPETQIVMLSVSAEDETLFDALKAGASGYLLKSMQAADFFLLISGLAEGIPPLAPELAAKVLAEFQSRLQTEATLSDEQSRILRRVAQGRTYLQIGLELSLSERTVRRYMKEIMQILHVGNRAEVERVARERGL